MKGKYSKINKMRIDKNKLNKSRKADVKLIESVGIMLIFFFILVMGMVFYARMSGISIEQKRQENLDRVAMNTALKASYMAELQCNAGDVGEGNQNCIDLEKIMAFQMLDEEAKAEYYQSFFEYAVVSVYQTYPPDEDLDVTLYNKPIPKAKTEINTLIPTALYDAASKKYKFGFLSVTTYCCAQK